MNGSAATARSRSAPARRPRRPGTLPPRGVPLRAPWHPGRFLERYFLVPLALSQTEAARRLGISRRRLNEVIQGRRGFTADTAIRCAALLGGDAHFWLSLHSACDTFRHWQALRRRQAAAAAAARRAAASSR